MVRGQDAVADMIEYHKKFWKIDDILLTLP